MPWNRLIIEATEAEAETLSDLLNGLGAAAVTFEDNADQPLFEPPPGATPLWRDTRVVGLFEADTDMQAVIAALTLALAPLSLPRWHSEVLEDQDWERVCLDAFEPMRFGEHLWIVPGWHEPPDPEGVNILLDPGLAFGTGTHPTTRLCLEWLDAHPTQGQTVVDYGSGSGILAIAAARLGATEVIAVDNDPQALLATRDNAERNTVTERIATFLPEDAPSTAVDVVLANILAGPLVELAPRLAALVRQGGHIVLSGILAEQAESVRAAYAAYFELAPTVEYEGWVRLDGRRK